MPALQAGRAAPVVPRRLSRRAAPRFLTPPLSHRHSQTGNATAAAAAPQAGYSNAGNST